MNDKELLELAALVAGVAGTYRSLDSDFEGEFSEGISEYYGYKWWNPLTDDGERYRLAKQLDIRIHFGAGYITYVVSGISRVLRWPEDVADDTYAIVSAAAEIGSSMKGQK